MKNIKNVLYRKSVFEAKYTDSVCVNGLASTVSDAQHKSGRFFAVFMKTPADIDQLARFACIRFSEEEKQIFQQQLQDMIGYCSKLEAIDTEGVEPLLHTFEQEDNVWGEDEPTMCDGLKMLEQNAPEMRDGQLVVPKVL